MAEIRIERKRRNLGWLWLLLALIIVAALAWYFLYPGRTTTAPAPAAPTTGEAVHAAPVRLTADGGTARAIRPTFNGGSHGEEG